MSDETVGNSIKERNRTLETPENKPPRLLDQVRSVARAKHLTYTTEKSYVDWIKRFIRYHRMRHPKEMGPNEISQFLSYLAETRHVAASTQNQALSALVFLYNVVLNEVSPKIDSGITLLLNHQSMPMSIRILRRSYKGIGLMHSVVGLSADEV